MRRLRIPSAVAPLSLHCIDSAHFPRVADMRIGLLALLLFVCSVPAAAQMPPVGRIEISGHSRLVGNVRALVTDLEGKPVPSDLEARLDSIAALPGVGEVSIDAVCCDGGFTTLYVAIREEGAPPIGFQEAPAGSVRLSPEIMKLGDRLDRALEDAVRRGVAQEDHAEGHALMADSAAQQVQREYMRVASSAESFLRDALATSSDPSHRALAAEILAYAPDKRSVVPSLLAAVRDPDPTVRNVAARALWIIAAYAAEHTDRGISIAPEPFIDLLESVEWTDRNKAAMVLMQLSATRDSALISSLRARAFDTLVDMARWSNLGHAFPGVVVLGRTAGLSEEAIFAALSGGRKDTVIEAAIRSRRAGSP